MSCVQRISVANDGNGSKQRDEGKAHRKARSGAAPERKADRREMVCDCKKDDCADCAPRKKIDTLAQAHADRRSTASARFQDEPSVPAKAAVPKAAAKKGPTRPCRGQ